MLSRFKRNVVQYSSKKPSVKTKGLSNRPGQNNCFLNSAVQVLWHLDVFRTNFNRFTGHTCSGESCIFCALKNLFARFKYSQDDILPPTRLRTAMAETFQEQNRFQLGLMDDAAECFENLLQRIHTHVVDDVEDMCSAKHCIPHQKFGMMLIEQGVCECGETSEPLPFVQLVHYVSATAICNRVKATERHHSGNHPDMTFSRLIRSVSRGRKKCPNDCGRMIETRTSLMNSPDVISIGIIWDSEEPNIENISELLYTINTSVKLQEMYHNILDKTVAKHEYHLSSIVCYYGKHYTTFFHNLRANRWVSIDDASVIEVGKHWKDVLHKCIKGHHQPLLLIYTNRSPVPISLINAPTAIKMTPSSIKSSPALSKREDPDSVSSSSDFETQPWKQIPADEFKNSSVSPSRDSEILSKRDEEDFSEEYPYYQEDNRDGTSDSSSSYHWRKDSPLPPVPERRNRQRFDVKYKEEDSNSLDDHSSSSSSLYKEKRHANQDESFLTSFPYREKYPDSSKSGRKPRLEDKYASRRMTDKYSYRDDLKRKHDHSETPRRKHRSTDDYSSRKYKYEDSHREEFISHGERRKESDSSEKSMRNIRSPEKYVSRKYQEDSHQDGMSSSSSSPHRERKKITGSKKADEDDLVDGFSYCKLQDDRINLPSKERKSSRRRKASNSKSYNVANGTSFVTSLRDRRRSGSWDKLDDGMSSGKYTLVEETRRPEAPYSRDKKPQKRVEGQAKTLPNGTGSNFRFQWHMANDSTNNNIGSYVEPSVAKWTTYKPYERQTSKAGSSKRDFDLYKM